MPSRRTVDDQPAWFLDEVAHAGQENLDPFHVARYDSKEDSGAADEVRLCRRLGLTPDSVLVEIGPGTGQFTLAAAPFCGRLVAVDVSPVMLRALRAKIDRARADNIEVVQDGFLGYEHRGAPADLVYTRYALHHLPDFWKVLALSRIRRVLGPGGVLRLWDVVYSFDPAEAEDRIEAWCASIDSTDDDSWNSHDVEDHVRDEHSTFSWLLEPMMERVGFTIEEAEYSSDQIFAKYVLRRH